MNNPCMSACNASIVHFFSSKYPSKSKKLLLYCQLTIIQGKIFLRQQKRAKKFKLCKSYIRKESMHTQKLAYTEKFLLSLFLCICHINKCTPNNNMRLLLICINSRFLFLSINFFSHTTLFFAHCAYNYANDYAMRCNGKYTI